MLLSTNILLLLAALAQANVQPSVRQAANLNENVAYVAEAQMPDVIVFTPDFPVSTISPGDDVYCDWCLKFFTTLKSVIGDVNNMTRDSLEEGLQFVCKYLEDDCPFMEKFCENFAPDLIDLIYDYVKEVEAEIQPLHDCKLMFFCWGQESETNTKRALQRLIVKQKIRLD
ncbi:hypothetical protein M3Y98_00904800 [Aphelenchoides besseyi]|nr:hypothetical protein M3Y98_00904800 [Aphelenchoides besseyi]KAI6193589.1 hypothetical protein M3Y96_01034200 [Aphelenchoides besseyi]